MAMRDLFKHHKLRSRHQRSLVGGEKKATASSGTVALIVVAERVAGAVRNFPQRCTKVSAIKMNSTFSFALPRTRRPRAWQAENSASL